jgi:hypothetical protein
VHQQLSLIRLNLRECNGLNQLPRTFCVLEYLEELNLHGTGFQDLPSYISKLPLTSLDLGSCNGLQVIPRSVWDLTTLMQLNLSCFRKLRRLPETISNLTGLTSLDLSQCESLESLPDALFDKMQLYKLNLTGCRNLKHLPRAFLNLVPDCQFYFEGSGFCKTYSFHPDKLRWYSVETVQRKVKTVMDMIDRLNKWEAYNNSLQHMSLIAVLLATAASVAFAQSPSQADAFISAGLDPASPLSFLRAFYIADQMTFVLAMGVVMLAQLHVSTLPFDVRKYGGDYNVAMADSHRAIRIWRQHFLLLGLLSAAVVSGIATFLFAGAAVYPHKHVFPFTNCMCIPPCGARPKL